MGEIRIEGLEKTFNSTRVLHAIDLHINEGEFVTLLGPSGCGKTTTLRCVAGLETPSSGKISIGAATVVDSALGSFIPPHRRRVGMVFQSYAIWPHMSARANVEFPLKRHKQGTRAEQQAIAQRALNSVGMSEYATRFPHELSGGQQQRIALARGLVAAGEVMLYDEPLSNLDAKLRVAMRDEVRRLHDEFGHTSIYVTHDQEEALAISDRVVIMNAGNIEQVGTPSDIFDRPATRYVADFIGFENILTVEDVSEGDVVAGGIRFSGVSGAQIGDALAFRSSNVIPNHSGPAAATFQAHTTRSVYLGEDAMLHLRISGGTEIIARVAASAAQEVSSDAQPLQTFSIPHERVVLLTA